MCQEDSTFGAEPKGLDRLIALGAADGGEEVAIEGGLQIEGPGGQVGRYKLLEVLGEGGMGIVYLAEQTHPVRRQVALKILKLGMDTRQVIARFEAERQALALMDHPSIARVFDAGATETGRPYFVMELVKGVSITEYCDGNSLSIKDRLLLFIQVCHAVQHAHQKGIIHRDLKPSNVLVTFHDGTAVPKIIDFGIAKATNQRLTEKTLFTRYGHITGTPAYMSPEQAQLTDLDIDTRSDIYSLGVLLYELLTGATPFSQEELREAGYLEIQRVIREQTPAKPSTKVAALGDTLADVARRHSSTPDLLRKALRGDLDWIVMKSLEKDRAQRYETASGLAEDVRRHLEHEPVQARGPSTTYRLGKFLRKHRPQVLAALALVLVATTAAVTLALWRRDHRQLEEAEGFHHAAILSQARGQYAQADRQAALRTVASILDSRHVGPEARLLYATLLVEGQLPDEAAALLDNLIHERREIAGAAHALLARLLWESQSANAEKLQEIEEHRRQAEALFPKTAEAYFLRAMTAITVKDQLGALDRALELDFSHYESHRLRAFIYYASRQYEKMKDDALAMMVLYPRDPLGYSLRGLAWQKLGRFPEALAEYDRALARTLATDPRHVELQGRRGEVLLRMGQYERVLTEVGNALQQAPNATVLEATRFCALAAMGRYDEAGALMQSIVAASEGSDADDRVREWSMKHVFNTLVAGGRWHPPERPPEGPAFFYLLEADEMYRGLCPKARPLIPDCFSPCWSPDGTKIAYAQGLPGYSGVAVYDLKSGETNLLFVPGKDPSWSPDGRHIAFVRDAPILRLSELATGRLELKSRTSARAMAEEVWVMRADGTDPRCLARRAHFPSWSADARHVHYYSPADATLCSIAFEDPQAQPVPVYTCWDGHPVLSPQGNCGAIMTSDIGLPAVLRIVDLDAQSCLAEWLTPLELWGDCRWSPDGRELILAGLRRLRGRTDLWIYDLAKKEAVKVLSGKFAGASRSRDGTRLLISLNLPYWEIWVADLDPNLSIAQSLEPVRTLEEHCLDSIAVCTRELEAVPDSYVDLWTRATAALWIGHPQAPAYLQEAKLALDKRFVVPYSYYMQAAHMLSHPMLWERLGDLGWLVARKAVEHQAGYANGLAAALERLGQHERAGWLRQLAQGNTPRGSCRHEKESDSYVVVGGGAGIWGGADEFHFAHKTLVGDGSITAKIENLEEISDRPKAGVMIRASLDSQTPFATVVVAPRGGVGFTIRPLTEQPTLEDNHVATAEQITLHTPVWLRLDRKGDQFSAFYSSDGLTWTTMVWSPQTIAMPESVHIGLVVTSHDNKTTAEARFSHVRTAGNISPPGPFTQSQDIRLPPPASSGDAGAKEGDGA